MKRVVTLGLLVATVVVVFAAASERFGLEGLWDRFRSGPRLPALRSKEMPFHYPAHLWRDGVEGEVLLKIHVTEAGSVDSVQLQRTSGHATLDSVALEGARRLVFHPAREGEQAVAVWAQLPVRFQRQVVTATPKEE